MKRLTRLGRWLAWLGGTAVLIFHILPLVVQKWLNRVASPPLMLELDRPHPIPVVDLHADPPLWRRDWRQRNNYGHIDLPRLIEGNVALQVFAAATQIPLGLNYVQNQAARPDMVTWLAISQRWPRRTWGSLLARALYMAQRVAQLEKESDGRFRLIKNAPDLQLLLTHRQSRCQLVGGLLALEGIHALEGDLNNLDVLDAAGFRIMGLTHFFDNEAGGSAHGVEQGGLTAYGRELVQRAQEKQMIIDLAHAAPRLIDDVLTMTRAPVIVSHTGLRGHCNSPRNLSDDHARGVADTGGLIGIAFFPETMCGTTIEAIARSFRYGADLVGVEHVAIGTDFDGAISAPIDASGMPYLITALARCGFTDDEIRAIMGGNALRLLSRYLPQE